jgi:crotonobetainyl-CoA:carnitine CoA-transferase CaiB-like acyl-CoA transferase
VLEDANVPATRIYTMADIFADPHFQARRMLVDVPHDQLGHVTMAGVVPKLSATPGVLHRSGGAVGRDTRRVLSELAGLSDDELDRLHESGVLACPPRARSAASTPATITE